MYDYDFHTSQRTGTKYHKLRKNGEDRVTRGEFCNNRPVKSVSRDSTTREVLCQLSSRRDTVSDADPDPKLLAGSDPKQS